MWIQDPVHHLGARGQQESAEDPLAGEGLCSLLLSPPWSCDHGRAVWEGLGAFLQLPLLPLPGAQFQAAWGSATSAASMPPTEARRAARWLPAGRRRAPSMAPRSGSPQGTRGPPAPLRAATARATPTGASSPTGGNRPALGASGGSGGLTGLRGDGHCLGGRSRSGLAAPGRARGSVWSG